jgi:hypothetical protein
LNHDSIDAGDAFVTRNDELVPWRSDVDVPNILRLTPGKTASSIRSTTPSPRATASMFGGSNDFAA